MKDREQIIKEVLAEMKKFDPKCNCQVDLLIVEKSGENIFFDTKPIILDMESRGLIFNNFNGTHSLERH